MKIFSKVIYFASVLSTLFEPNGIMLLIMVIGFIFSSWFLYQTHAKPEVIRNKRVVLNRAYYKNLHVSNKLLDEYENKRAGVNIRKNAFNYGGY